VWILGGPRTGSSWLLELLVYPLTVTAEAPSGAARRANPSGVEPRAVPINEPYLGVHLAPIVSARPGAVFTAGDIRAQDANYFFDARSEPAWRPHLRRLILERFAAQAELAIEEHGLRDPLVVVKEPNGSEAAPILLSTLPGSRVLFLLRDRRDVLDSQLDAVRPGSWLAGDADPEGVSTEAGRIEFLRRNAALWLHRIGLVERAVEAHPPDLAMTVRYERLRADPRAELRSIASWLHPDSELAADIDEAVAANTFEAAPPEVRGRDKPLRAARPGAWRDNLSPAEQTAILEIIGDKLLALGYEV